MGNHRSDETSSPARPQGDQPSSPPATSPRAEIDRFLDQVKAFGPVAKTGPRGRLIFALDATMSPLYVTGLIGPGDRKSVQPMAERLAPGDYDQLHHFVAAGVWDAAPLETELLIQADRLVGGSDAVLVIDDTAVPKKGKHSVGVASQYGSALVHIKINSANDGTTNANNLEPPRALDRRAWREILLYS